MSQDVKYFIECVTNILKEESKEKIVDIQEIVQQSTFYELIQEEPLFVTHYPPEYWAEDIYKEQIERK
ncbi:hypothetical protein [Bacillus sp. NPDC094106]|uniref:hypothetical protein n=1 Tax=Bacillus sp. NPDC094106 TaxID=3363949 RepID=UPI0038174AA1